MERYNEHYKDFLVFLSKYDKNIKIIEENHEKYLRDFIQYNLIYMDDISNRNCDIFKYKYLDAEVVKGMKFRKLFEKLSKKDLDLFWTKLHSLYVLLYNCCDLKKYIKKHYEKRQDLLEIVRNNKTYIENIMLSKNNISTTIDHSTKDNKNNLNENSDNNNDSDNNDNDSDNDNETIPDLAGLLKSVGSLFQQPLNKNKTEEYKTEESKTEESKTEESKTEESKTEDSKTEESKTEEDKTGEDKTEEDKTEPNIQHLFEGTLIGNLAKELSQEIDPSEFGEINNPMELMQKLFLGGDNKLGNIMGKVMGKLDQKMKNGDVDKNKLMTEAQKMMGSMMGSMMGNNGSDMMNMMNMMSTMSGLGGKGKKHKFKKTSNKRKK